MAIDFPAKNKMMEAAPAKKSFHFAATVEYLAEYIQAATIEEAEAIYRKVRRPLTVPLNEPEQSTGGGDLEITE